MAGRPNKTGYAGVTLRTDGGDSVRYRTEIRRKDCRKALGTYKDPLNAAIIYDNAFEELFGGRPNNTDPDEYDPESRITRFGDPELKRLDLTGKVYGRLTVIEFSHSTSNYQSLWRCKCDCGNETLTCTANLNNGKCKSCGCIRKGLNATHGMTGTPEYMAWASLRGRCNNLKDKGYCHYGGRGIKCCERWDKFENFYEDMGPRPSDKHSIDRIDNDGNYEPNNCRWATREVQMSNRRRGKSGFVGVEVQQNKTSTSYMARIVIDHKRMSLGTYSDALSAAIAYDNEAEKSYGIRPNNTNKEDYDPTSRLVRKYKNKEKQN